MSEPKVTVEGIPETIGAFREFSHAVEDDLEPANQSARIVAGAARGLAPIRTGELAAGYTVVERYVVNDVGYANLIEYGVGAYGTPGQYVVRRAIEGASSEIESIYAGWVAKKATDAGFEQR